MAESLQLPTAKSPNAHALMAAGRAWRSFRNILMMFAMSGIGMAARTEGRVIEPVRISVNTEAIALPSGEIAWPDFGPKTSFEDSYGSSCEATFHYSSVSADMHELGPPQSESVSYKVVWNDADDSFSARKTSITKIWQIALHRTIVVDAEIEDGGDDRESTLLSAGWDCDWFAYLGVGASVGFGQDGNVEEGKSRYWTSIHLPPSLGYFCFRWDVESGSPIRELIYIQRNLLVVRQVTRKGSMSERGGKAGGSLGFGLTWSYNGASMSFSGAGGSGQEVHQPSFGWGTMYCIPCRNSGPSWCSFDSWSDMASRAELCTGVAVFLTHGSIVSSWQSGTVTRATNLGEAISVADPRRGIAGRSPWSANPRMPGSGIPFVAFHPFVSPMSLSFNEPFQFFLFNCPRTRPPPRSEPSLAASDPTDGGRQHCWRLAPSLAGRSLFTGCSCIT